MTHLLEINKKEWYEKIPLKMGREIEETARVGNETVHRPVESPRTAKSGKLSDVSSERTENRRTSRQRKQKQGEFWFQLRAKSNRKIVEGKKKMGLRIMRMYIPEIRGNDGHYGVAIDDEEREKYDVA